MEIAGKEIVDFLLILLRASIVFGLLPFFGSKNMPNQFKIGFVIAFALVLTPVIDIKINDGDIPFILLSEVIGGIILGLVVRSIFIVAEMAGQVISNVMGFSMATVFDPEAGHSTDLSRLFWIISIFIFFSSGIHRDVVYIFAKTYEIIPPGRFSLAGVIGSEGNAPGELINLTGAIFKLTLKMASGAVVVMLTLNIIMGFISRSVPQLNVFFVSYPVYIGLGFFVIMLSLPAYIYFFNTSFEFMKDELNKVIFLLRG